MAGSQITDEASRAAVRGWVESQYNELDRSSYYRLLQVPETAHLEQIRTAYYKLVARLHPDLYVETLDAETRRKLISIYSRIVEGYQCLSDGAKRQQYDHGLKSGKLRYVVEEVRPQSRTSTGVVSMIADIKTENGRRFFKLAQDAMRAGNGPAAVQNLNFALSQEPGNAFLKAALEQAKAMKPRK
jgi:DnaJ-class molecular chaperone